MSGHVAEEPDFGESGGGGWKGGHLRFDLDEGVVWKGKMNVNCTGSGVRKLQRIKKLQY